MFRAMIAAEQLQQLIVPGLNSKADSCYAQSPKQRCFPNRDAAGICFHRPLDESGQIQFIAKAAEQVFQLRSCQRRRSAAAEINCRWNQQGTAVSRPPRRLGSRRPLMLLEFSQNCLAEPRRL